jgi:hypothetical protein
MGLKKFWKRDQGKKGAGPLESNPRSSPYSAGAARSVTGNGQNIVVTPGAPDGGNVHEVPKSEETSHDQTRESAGKGKQGAYGYR